jgi:hypothetical protein
MPLLSYTAWRRMIELLANDRREYGTDLDWGCCFGKYKAVRSRDLLSEIDKGINVSPIAVCTRLRHLRFLRKFSHRRPNRGCLITRPKRSDSECNERAWKSTTKKISTCFFCGKAKGHNFLGHTGSISNELPTH